MTWLWIALGCWPVAALLVGLVVGRFLHLGA